jgi:hypothetical protein
MPGIGRTYEPLCATARGQIERWFDWNRDHAESKPTQPSFSVMPRLAGSTFGAHTLPRTGPAHILPQGEDPHQHDLDMRVSSKRWPPKAGSIAGGRFRLPHAQSSRRRPGGSQLAVPTPDWAQSVRVLGYSVSAASTVLMSHQGGSP